MGVGVGVSVGAGVGVLIGHIGIDSCSVLKNTTEASESYNWNQTSVHGISELKSSLKRASLSTKASSQAMIRIKNLMIKVRGDMPSWKMENRQKRQT